MYIIMVYMTCINLKDKDKARHCLLSVDNLALPFFKHVLGFFCYEYGSVSFRIFLAVKSLLHLGQSRVFVPVTKLANICGKSRRGCLQYVMWNLIQSN